MAKTEVITLDLDFQGMKQAVAVYLIKHFDRRDPDRMWTRLDSPRASIGSQITWLFPI